jgi:hypothetical protein
VGDLCQPCALESRRVSSGERCFQGRRKGATKRVSFDMMQRRHVTAIVLDDSKDGHHMRRVAIGGILFWFAFASCGGGSTGGSSASDGGSAADGSSGSGSGGSNSSSGSGSSSSGSGSSGSSGGSSCAQGGAGTVTGTLNGATVSTAGNCWTAAYYPGDGGPGYGTIGLHDMQDSGLSIGISYDATAQGKPCTWQTGTAYALSDLCVVINVAGYASGALAWTGSNAYPPQTTGSVTFSSLAVASGQTTAFTLSSDAAVGVYLMSSQTTVAMPITGSGSAVVP